jgi:general secretion pathway protein E
MAAEVLPLVTTDDLLAQAIRLGASDLHLDPADSGMKVRMRVDGRFIDHDDLPAEAAARLIGRLKVMAGLQVYRSDIPQEGRLELPAGREGRLALIPTIAGEKATLRIFGGGSSLNRLDSLALDPGSLSWLRRQLMADHGLVLVVGPSGSGKTTTLYASLAEIIDQRGEFCHVTTIEDPVERRLPGCVQVQVDPVRELGFAAGLKFLLRQDPEVVMVGEIRDAETARIAVRASMTGHLVLSTMHCGRAAEARPRLLEMGVEPWAVDIALSGVIAQRLLRKLCSDCQGAGCEQCLGTGYRGRMVITEVLDRDAHESDSSWSLQEMARRLADAGQTTRQEVVRVLGGEA